MQDVAKATLERLVQIMVPMDGAKVLKVEASTFTLRLERVRDPSALGEVGKMHLHLCTAHDEEEAWSSVPLFEGVIAEDDDFVYSGAGELEMFDDEGCGGQFDIEVHVVPKAERPALVATLMEALRKRATAGETENPTPRTIYKRIAIDPFTKKPRAAYFDAAGMIVGPRAADVIVDETE